MTWSTATSYEFWDDPMAKMFGEYLFARDVLRQQLVDLYHAYGVDPSIGHQVRRTLLRDLRPVRRTSTAPATATSDEEKSQGLDPQAGDPDRRCNNVGLVRFDPARRAGSRASATSCCGSRSPSRIPRTALPPDPAGLVHGVELRTDWMGTVHECSWTPTRTARVLPGTE